MPETQKGLKLTMGLDHLHEEHKNFFINGVKPWPQSLDDATHRRQNTYRSKDNLEEWMLQQRELTLS